MHISLEVSHRFDANEVGMKNIHAHSVGGLRRVEVRDRSEAARGKEPW